MRPIRNNLHTKTRETLSEGNRLTSLLTTAVKIGKPMTSINEGAAECLPRGLQLSNLRNDVQGDYQTSFVPVILRGKPGPSVLDSALLKGAQSRHRRVAGQTYGAFRVVLSAGGAPNIDIKRKLQADREKFTPHRRGVSRCRGGLTAEDVV